MDKNSIHSNNQSQQTGIKPQRTKLLQKYLQFSSLISNNIYKLLEMQFQKKRTQFAISIRRKQITQKMQAMRSVFHSAIQINCQKYYPILTLIQKGEKPVNQCLQELKILAYVGQGAKGIFQGLVHYKLYEWMENGVGKMKTAEYNDVLTILINLCVHVQLDIPNTAMQFIVKSIVDPERQMISLWFVANVIYQRSAYSAILASELIQKCDVIQFMQKRVKEKFECEGDFVILNFFCCSFLTVSSCISVKHVKAILEIVQEILKFEEREEQNFWFLSEALVQHGQHIGASQYQIFGTEIMKKFELCCKNKKTRYVKNYLKMLIGFTSSDKMAYEKMLKYETFRSLDFCLENRFPEVKKLCAEIGWNLLRNFGEKVDYENVGFFSQLVLELLHIEKLSADVQIAIIRYSYKFFEVSISNMVTRQSKQKFIDEILQSNVINILSTVLINSNNNIELIGQILFLFVLLMKIDENKKIIKRCSEEKIGEFLVRVRTGNEGVDNQIQGFLHFFN